jgi:hypothetical protein
VLAGDVRAAGIVVAEGFDEDELGGSSMLHQSNQRFPVRPALLR